MKKLLTTLVLSALLTGWAYAANDTMAGQGMQNGMMMGPMSNEQMQDMHKQMGNMQSMMTDIKAEKDPKKRSQMLMQHMAAMQHGMQMMMGSTGGDQSQHQGMNGMDMGQRMNMMEQRMSIMQMMMEQMMEHDEQMQHHDQ
ncbi:hypothetical protein KDN34_15395 [Shewanella yunxiaonensis]|uniref:Uncharacterized protein n=1 Tax=Shewanella yunxiaonensis TaxID=2829809 RepID=A0ABX7YTA1_9GAMM|nr:MULTISPECIES: hypothetical protein [Shewanella]MDF0536047.1 hypothetical protein [Shewanella sp. A32]QUN05554.1 hypothetical protein KDN34_15395 [Shewanella yunxiaonensis]